MTDNRISDETARRATLEYLSHRGEVVQKIDLSERLRATAAGTGHIATFDMKLHDEAADAIDARDALIEQLEGALQKSVDMNVQYALDRFDDPNVAETMACIKTSRAALTAARAAGYGGRGDG